MGWMIGVTYAVCVLLTFRWQYLVRTEIIERAVDAHISAIDSSASPSKREQAERKIQHKKEDWEARAVASSAVWAAAWPVPVALLLLRKLLFPRGIKTKYAAQKARIEELEEKVEKFKTNLKILQVEDPWMPRVTELELACLNGLEQELEDLKRSTKLR